MPGGVASQAETASRTVPEQRPEPLGSGRAPMAPGTPPMLDEVHEDVVAQRLRSREERPPTVICVIFSTKSRR